MGNKLKLRADLKALSQQIPRTGTTSDAFAALYKGQYLKDLRPEEFECTSIVDLVQMYGSPHLRLEERPSARGSTYHIFANPQAGARPKTQLQQQRAPTAKAAKPSIDSGAALIRSRLHGGGIQVTHARMWDELTQLGYTDQAVRSSQELREIEFLERQLDIMIVSFIACRYIT
jgi:hypothetical protein